MPLAQDSPKDGQRIAKLLARAGVASRREIERMIAEGRIALNGEKLDTPATILTSLHGVTVDGKPVKEPAPARLFRFHKPTGLLTAERDPKGRPTIYDRLPADLPRVMPVGRLDLNTEGLLLLTTDGELKRQLELPRTGVERTYRARAYGDVSQDQLEDLIEGVEIDGVRYGSIDANLERRTGANTWIELRLTEGKNREVRRVLEYLGLQVSRLIRTSYGPFALDGLAVGGIDEIRRHDLVVFRNSLSNEGTSSAPLRKIGSRDASPRPVRKTGERDNRPAPARKTGDRDARPAPARKTGDRDTRPAPARKTGDRDARPAPARKAGERGAGPKPARKTGDRGTGPAPARKDGDRPGRGAPARRGSAPPPRPSGGGRGRGR